jgi:hypothetical protein
MAHPCRRVEIRNQTASWSTISGTPFAAVLRHGLRGDPDLLLLSIAQRLIVQRPSLSGRGR